MPCPEVRDLLPEHAVHALPPDRRTAVDRHLAWCAGCRHEARELAEGAAALAVGLPSPAPPAALEDRVVASVSEVAGRRAGRGVRLAAVAAAAVAVASVGIAVATVGRLGSLRDQAREARAEADRAAREFQEVIGGLGREDRLVGATLAPALEGQGGGRAVLYDSPSRDDLVLVIVGGLPADRGPYWATLRLDGARIGLGQLHPSAEGQLASHRLLDGKLSGYRTVVVQDRIGRTVLRGTLRPST